jgi:hypothetical protein
MLSPCNLYFCYPLGVINKIFTLSLQKKKKSVGMMVSMCNLIEFMLRETKEGSNCHNLKIIK